MPKMCVCELKSLATNSLHSLEFVRTKLMWKAPTWVKKMYLLLLFFLIPDHRGICQHEQITCNVIRYGGSGRFLPLGFIVCLFGVSLSRSRILFHLVLDFRNCSWISSSSVSAESSVMLSDNESSFSNCCISSLGMLSRPRALGGLNSDIAYMYIRIWSSLTRKTRTLWMKLPVFWCEVSGKCIHHGSQRLLVPWYTYLKSWTFHKEFPMAEIQTLRWPKYNVSKFDKAGAFQHLNTEGSVCIAITHKLYGPASSKF